MGVALGKLAEHQGTWLSISVWAGAAWSPCPPDLPLLPPQGRVWSWEDGEHQEGHPVPGPCGIISKGQEGTWCPCKPQSLGPLQTCHQQHLLSWAALHIHSWCRGLCLPVLAGHLLCARPEARSEQAGDVRLALSPVGWRAVLGTSHMLHSEAWCV